MLFCVFVCVYVCVCMRMCVGICVRVCTYFPMRKCVSTLSGNENKLRHFQNNTLIYWFTSCQFHLRNPGIIFSYATTPSPHTLEVQGIGTFACCVIAQLFAFATTEKLQAPKWHSGGIKMTFPRRFSGREHICLSGLPSSLLFRKISLPFMGFELSFVSYFGATGPIPATLCCSLLLFRRDLFHGDTMVSYVLLPV